MTTAPPPEASFAPGAIVGRYRIVRRIGRGGMGEVFEARHTALGRTVALKTLYPHLAADPTLHARFHREGVAAAAIRHPHVADVHDVATHGDVTYLVMEHLTGEDLHARIKRDKRVPWQELVDLMVPVCDAVAHVHRAGVVHRDLKPANIFLARSPNGLVVPKVLDFGISKLSHDLLADDASEQPATATATLLGTPWFMAPEVVEGARNASPASDQYALGVILYHAATGSLPFRGSNLHDTLSRILSGRFPCPGELVPELPAAFEAVVLRAMALRPGDRFAQVGALTAALLALASPGVRARWQSQDITQYDLEEDAAPLSLDPLDGAAMTPAPLSHPAPAAVGALTPPPGNTHFSMIRDAPASIAPLAPRRTRLIPAATLMALGLIAGSVAYVRRPAQRPAQPVAAAVAPRPAPIATPPPAPVVEAPVVEAPAPVVEAPVVEAPAPVVEAPALAARTPTPRATPTPAPVRMRPERSGARLRQNARGGILIR